MTPLKHYFSLQLGLVSGESVLPSDTQIALNQCNFHNSIWQSYERLTCSAIILLEFSLKLHLHLKKKSDLVCK